jgi:UMF1 family MFS transporter
MKPREAITILSWALYDFANTIFSMNVISLYFALWVTVDKGAQDIFYGLSLSVSLVLAAIFEPVIGAFSDWLKRRMPFLIFFTLFCCFFTGLIGFAKGLTAGLIFFGLANFGYQLAGVFYNALLPGICRPSQIGRVSGLGVGMGYLGTIFGLILVGPFVLRWGRQSAFVPTAILFFIFALPCFLLVKETAVGDKLQIRNPLKRIRQTFSDRERFSTLLYFLAAAFLFLNAINTVIVFMSVYIRKIGGFNDAQIISFYLFSTFFAIIGSVLSGLACDRLTPQRVLNIALGGWAIALALAGFWGHGSILWFIGPIIGLSLGSTWSAARALLVRLCPEEKLGEAFGLFGAVGKSSSIVGPLLWGLIVWAFDRLGPRKYNIAVLTQLLFLILGWLVLRKGFRQNASSL